MKILQINQTYKLGSTGKIMSDLNDVIVANGHTGYMLCAYSLENQSNLYVMDNGTFPLNSKRNILKMRITGLNGYGKKRETKKALEWIEDISPDLIHLHNVHGDWINLELLFQYLKEKKTPVIWTLHDCWAFTGRCSHFELCGCEKWKTECYHCKNKKVYPITYGLDFSSKMFSDKKNLFTALDSLNIVTPSDWLARYVKDSYLGAYPCTVIHNGIDLSLFKKKEIENRSIFDFEKKILLGVANTWSDSKGLSDFIRLDSLLDHEKFQVVLVGLNNKQIKNIPDTILGISRTNNVSELIELYSSAYLFVNLTYQDNYPTTNLEAVACGTPIITYNTGGSPEAVIDGCGVVVDKGDLHSVLNLVDTANLLFKDCDKLRNTAIKYFDKGKCYTEYLFMYRNILEDRG